MSSIIWVVSGSKKVIAPGKHGMKEAQDTRASPATPPSWPPKSGGLAALLRTPHRKKATLFIWRSKQNMGTDRLQRQIANRFHVVTEKTSERLLCTPPSLAPKFPRSQSLNSPHCSEPGVRPKELLSTWALPLAKRPVSLRIYVKEGKLERQCQGALCFGFLA